MVRAGLTLIVWFRCHTVSVCPVYCMDVKQTKLLSVSRCTRVWVLECSSQLWVNCGSLSPDYESTSPDKYWMLSLLRNRKSLLVLSMSELWFPNFLQTVMATLTTAFLQIWNTDTLQNLHRGLATHVICAWNVDCQGNYVVYTSLFMVYHIFSLDQQFRCC